jgi:hypothetical protein
VFSRRQEGNVSPEETAPKVVGAKKTGKKSASSFGGSPTSGKSPFGFSGKAQVSGGGGESARQKAAERKFAKDVKAHPSSGGGSRKKPGRGKAPALKVEPKGKEDCDQASALQLCTWL